MREGWTIRLCGAFIETRRTPVYVSAKRTQFTFAHFAMYHIYYKEVMKITAAFTMGIIYLTQNDTSVNLLQEVRCALW